MSTRGLRANSVGDDLIFPLLFGDTVSHSAQYHPMPAKILLYVAKKKKVIIS